MSEFGTFVIITVGGGLFLLLASPVENVLFRIGLWMNAIDGAERDSIMEWHRTGKLPPW